MSFARRGRRYLGSLTEVESVVTLVFRRPSKKLGRDFTGLKLQKTSSTGAKTVQHAINIKLTSGTVVRLLRFTRATFERVAINIVGLLPRTQPSNQYILTVVDHFIKKVKAYALPDQEAVLIARVHFNEFILRFGVPYIIHTDQGANFESNIFKELFQLLNIKKTRTSLYNPQCVYQVERMNRNLIELLALNVADPTKNWDLNLGIVLIAYRSAV